MKLFLDVNTIIDMLVEDRNAMSDEQYAEVLSMIGYRNLYCSALSVHIVFYILKLKYDSDKYYRVRKFFEFINILPIGDMEVKLALNTPYKDFEDSLQFFSAFDKCDAILTSDSKDFLKLNNLLGQDIKIFKNWKEVLASIF
jgi:hypothetical protein